MKIIIISLLAISTVFGVEPIMCKLSLSGSRNKVKLSSIYSKRSPIKKHLIGVAWLPKEHILIKEHSISPYSSELEEYRCYEILKRGESVKKFCEKKNKDDFYLFYQSGNQLGDFTLECE